MMTISQIIFGQYHIWDIFGLGVKSKVFCRKKNLNDGNHEQGTDSAKMGVNNSAKIPEYPAPKFFVRSAQLAQNFRTLLKKASLGIGSP